MKESDLNYRAISIPVLAAILGGGCSTMTFENPQAGAAATPETEWHHVWAFDLYEGSKPVNLEQRCGEAGWSSVKTETSFLNGFAEVFTSPVWHPETATVSCQSESP